MQALLEHLSHANTGRVYYVSSTHNISSKEEKPIYLPKGFVVLHDVLPVFYIYSPDQFTLTDKSIYVDEHGAITEGDEGVGIHVAESMKDPEDLLKFLHAVHSKQ